jgi:hypothetical protein
VLVEQFPNPHTEVEIAVIIYVGRRAPKAIQLLDSFQLPGHQFERGVRLIDDLIDLPGVVFN